MKNIEISTVFGKTKIYFKHVVNSKEIVLVVPGFSETLAHSRPIIDNLFKRGISAMTFNPPRKVIDSKLSSIDRQGQIAQIIIRQALQNAGKVHILAHSLGCAATLKAVAKIPMGVASLTLMQPVGLSRNQGFFKLFWKTLKKLWHNLIQIRVSNKRNIATPTNISALYLFFASMWIVMKNPNLAVKEAIEAGKYSINSDIEDIIRLGIPVHIVVSKYDELFSYEEAVLSMKKLSHLVASVSIIDDRNRGHDTFFIDPTLTSDLVLKRIVA